MGAIKNVFSKVAPVYFFLVVSTLAGLIFVFLTPPFQGGDEPLHFYRAYQISELNLAVDSNAGNDYGGILPASLVRTVALTTNNSSLGNLQPGEKYHFIKTHQAMHIKEEPQNRQWVNFTATALYPPVAYLPQAIGVSIVRLLHLPPIMMMYAGRTMNLAFWIGLICLSIRLIPRKKWALVFVGLLPVAISQAASMSADIMTIGLFAVFIAYILNTLDKTAIISRKQLLGLLVIAVAMALCKQVMIVFLPLVLLMSGNAFKSKKDDWLWKTALIAVPIICYGLWMYVIRHVDLKSVYSHHQNPPAQISHVLHYPFNFIHALWNTYFFKFGDSVTHSFIGTFGWGDTSLAEIFVVFGYVGLFILLFADTDRFKLWLSQRQKYLMVIVGLLYFIGVSAALYAYYNPVGAQTISGLQGRYFLPLAILAIPLTYSKWISVSRHAYKITAVFIPIFLLTASVITIAARYYG